MINYNVDYSYCDFSHLFNQLSLLTSFSSITPYGQLASRVIGLAASQGQTLITCIYDGTHYINGKDYTDVGVCTGTLTSQVLDASF